MPCTSCGTEFGIFKKEHGCKNCGFAFCGSCLTKKAVVPKLGAQKHSVCNRCFEMLNSKQQVPQDQSAQYSPPAALQRRMDALQDKRGNKPFTNYSYENATGDDAKNQVIASRLEKLRNDKRGSVPVPSERELEERLAKLKGVNPVLPQIQGDNPSQSQKVYYHPPDHRTAAEQSASLFKRMHEEVILDSKLPKPEEEIANRLSRLRGDDEPWNDLNNPGKSRSSTSNVTAGGKQHFSRTGAHASPDILQNLPNNIGSTSMGPNMNEVHLLVQTAAAEAQLDAERAIRGIEADKELKRKLDELKANQDRSSRSMQENEDSEEEEDDKLTDKLIEKLLAESALEESCKDINFRPEKKELNTPDSEQASDTEELPWCNICNEDAFLRCIGCDGELYCSRCFRECHDSSELKDHKTTTYKPVRKQV